MHKNNSAFPGRVLVCLALVVASVQCLPVQAAQAVTQQILDRVMVFNGNAVLNMATGNAARPPDFTNTGVSGVNFSTCALTAVNGLYCLDGKSLRNWPNPSNPAVSSEILNCADPRLGLEGRADACTGLAVDQAGAIWLAGKKRNTHSVIKIVRKTSACPGSAWVTLSGGTLCALEYYSGRPSLIDITVVDGDAAKQFRACPGCALQAGVIGMEERKNAVFFPDPQAGQPILIASSKDWGLSGKELLQDVALLQVPNGSGVDNYVLATTSTGRVLAKNTAVAGLARKVFDIPLERTGARQCNAEAQQYGLRASSTSTVVYLSDRNFCQLVPLVPDSTAFLSLVNVQEDGADLVLSTVDADAEPDLVYAPMGLAVAPGISILLSDCRLSCAIVNSSGGAPAATLLTVQLVDDTNSGATVFQVKGIPDCRYGAVAGFTGDLLTACNQPNVVVSPDPVTGMPAIGGSALCGIQACDPAAQWLNVTPLLPADVVSAFKASGLGNGTLPPLLVSPQYRGQSRNDFVFEALFVVTNPSVRFRNTFSGEFNVAGLEGASTSLGCVPGTNLIAWDVSTTVSELYKSVGGNYVDTITNVGCGSTKTLSSRMSLLPYDLELSPDTYGPTITSPVPVLTRGNDAVFARLMQTLYGQLGTAQRDLACQQVDPVPSGGTPPLPASLCSTLDGIWLNGKEKLDKCILAGFQPKQSAGDENCQSFVSQLGNYQARLPATTVAADIANRTGELKARIAVIFHVYYQRYLPSIPADGFCRERSADPGSCPNPWY